MKTTLILFTLLLAFAPPGAGEPGATLRLKRVRGVDAGSTQLIVSSIDRSAIVRRLIADVEASKVMVFVGFESEMTPQLAGHTTLLGRAGTFRYVRITLSRRLMGHDAVATFAHELEHVRELIANPDVDDELSLEALYRRIGHHSERAGRRTVDTDGARRMGYAVRREIVTGSGPMPGDPPAARSAGSKSPTVGGRR